MNALPLVSVVVPNYNYKRYLNLRIQSILQQTYQNIELILLDDASTDGSEEVLSDYQDHAKVSHILLNEHNTGNPFTAIPLRLISRQSFFLHWLSQSQLLCGV